MWKTLPVPPELDDDESFDEDDIHATMDAWTATGEWDITLAPVDKIREVVGVRRRRRRSRGALPRG